MKISVSSASDLTPNGVRKLISSGKEIVATPHLGNRWRSDMATNEYLGANNVVFSRNQSEKDISDFPEFVRLGGKMIRISNNAHQARLSPYLSLDVPGITKENIEWILAFWNTPAQIHHRSAKRLLWDGRNRLDAKYLFLEDSRMQDILAALAVRFPDLNVFDRFVDAEGRVGPIASPVAGSAAGEGVFRQFMDFNSSIVKMVIDGESLAPESSLPSNAVMVLLLAIKSLFVEMENGTIGRRQSYAKVYAISGESMIRYAKSKPFVEAMGRYYSAIREIRPEFPESLEISYIPWAELDVVPMEGESELAEVLCQYGRLFREMETLTVRIAAGSPADRPIRISAKNAVKGQRLQVRRQAAALLKDRPFHSQYDAIRSGEKLAVLPELLDLPLKEFALLTKGE